MVQIKTAKLKNVKDIVKLKQELSMSLAKKRYKRFAIFRNVGFTKDKFYKLSRKLNNTERAFLYRLIGHYAWEKKRRILRKKFKPIFLEFCKRHFLIDPNFTKTVKTLAEKGFIKSTSNYIFFSVPDEELLSVEDRISEDLLIGYVSKKQKLEKPRLKSIYLLAQEKNKIYGYLWGYITIFSSYSTAEIDELVVTRKAQGKGIGSMLINKFLDICKKNNVSFAIVCTPGENKDTIKFYEKCGFKKEENIYLYWELNS
ncbi:GNAT family N-acetyltransferase [Candidatus Atribacteria bacterium MT.SAG.1]|nr:GNAT family N-acetyltransferase [Candidatus Atribacteria bacterium MT.SAG.1]